MERPQPDSAGTGKRGSRDLLYALFFWSLCSAVAGAENNDQANPAEDEENNNSEQNEEQQAEFDIPDLEFIEFLGQFETDAGEWIAPGNLLMNEFDDFLEVVANQQDTDN